MHFIMNFQAGKNKASIGDLFVPAAPGHQRPPISSTQHLFLLYFQSMRHLLMSLCLFWSATSPERHWKEYLVSLVELEHRLVELHIRVRWAVFIMSRATNQSLQKILTGSWGEGEWQFPVGTSAWLESTQLPCQYPPVHQMIRYTHTLQVYVPQPVSADRHTLMGFLRDYKGTEETGVEKRITGTGTEDPCVPLHCSTPIKGVLTTGRPQQVCDKHPR